MQEGVSDHTSALANSRVIALAYACCPREGSEKGVGWGLVRALARFTNPVVLVGAKYAPEIREWQARHPLDNVEFIEVPEPRWERGIRRQRVGDFIGYLAWLRRAGKIAQSLHRQQPFDIAFHLTYSTYWLPSPVTQLGIPSVWGPVGGAVKTPRSLLPVLGIRGVMVEWLDALAVRFATWWPATRRTWRSCNVCLALNDETLSELPDEVAARAKLLNHILLLDLPRIERANTVNGILYVSPLESRKGTRLALHALSHTPSDVTLTIVGDGPERKSLERLAEKLGLSSRVNFAGRISRSEVFGELARAAAVLFTGTREEGGVSLGEALLAGAPVIVLAHGGPVAISAYAEDQSRVALIEPGSIADTARRMGAAMLRYSREKLVDGTPNLNQSKAHGMLRDSMVEALGLGRKVHG